MTRERNLDNPAGNALWRELTDDNYEKHTRGGINMLLLYSASSGPAPGALLDRAAGLPYDDNISFYAMDADSNHEAYKRYGAPGLPALVSLRNGNLKNALQRVANHEQVIEAARANACYRCIITRSRTRERTQRGRRRLRR